jgi:DNA polymerase-3 subunit epsilon
LREQHEFDELTFGFMHTLTKTPKHQLRQFYAKHKVKSPVI